MGIEVRQQGLTELLHRYRQEQVPRVRREAIETGLSEVVDDIANETPVQTGRARRGWQSARVGSIQSAAGEGSGVVQDSRHETKGTATNEVPYIRFLEYGTRKIGARRIGARVLAQHVQGILSRLKRALFPEN